MAVSTKLRLKYRTLHTSEKTREAREFLCIILLVNHCNGLQYLELSSEKSLILYNNYRLLEFSDHPTTYSGVLSNWNVRR